MKHLFQAKALLAALVLSTAVQAAEDKKINVSILNQFIAKLVQEVLVAHRAEPNPFFKDIELKIDEKATDLNSEDRIKLKLAFSATADKTRWFAGDTKVSASIGGGADRNTAVAYLDISGALETDTPSLIRFAARELEKEACRPGPATSAAALANDKAACEEVRKLAKAKDVTEMFSGLQKIASLLVNDLELQIADLEAALATVPADEKAYIERRIANKKQEQATAQLISDELKRATVVGNTAKLSVKKMRVSDYSEVTDLDLYLDKGKLEIGLRISGTNLKPRDLESYFQMKPAIEAEILKLQNGDAQTIKEIRGFVQFLVGGAKEFLTGIQ